jgi:hypothetical protein
MSTSGTQSTPGAQCGMTSVQVAQVSAKIIHLMTLVDMFAQRVETAMAAEAGRASASRPACHDQRAPRYGKHPCRDHEHVPVAERRGDPSDTG